MVYNNASLLGVPMETIIKLFRRQLGKKSYCTLRQYGEALIRFLDGNEALFPRALQDRYFLHAVEAEYLRIRDSMRDRFVERDVYGDGNDEADVAEAVIAERLAFWEEQEEADYLTKDVRAADVVAGISGGVSGVVHDVFFGWPVGEKGVMMLSKIAEHLVEKDEFPLDVFSGLVIAGFGEEEHYPVVQHIEVGGVYGGRLKVRPPAVDAVTEDEPADIQAFAYKVMVERFLVGISGSEVGHLDNAATFVREMPVRAVESVAGLDDAAREQAIKAARRMGEESAREFKEIARQRFNRRWRRIVGAVEALTISELAHVASTLVGLSSFEQQMSPESETVGGPVDVAVISKGDGFIWIDRKHYFGRELNDHFFRNYYEDVGGKDEDAYGRQEEDSSDGE